MFVCKVGEMVISQTVLKKGTNYSRPLLLWAKKNEWVIEGQSGTFLCYSMRIKKSNNGPLLFLCNVHEFVCTLVFIHFETFTRKKKNACSCFKHACVCVRYCCVRLVRKKLVLPGVAQTLFRFVEHGCQALLDVCMLGMCASYAVWIDYSFRKSYFYAKNSGFPLWIQLEDEAQSWLVACPYPSDAQNFGILLKHV